jgi:hypothetical protein
MLRQSSSVIPVPAWYLFYKHAVTYAKVGRVLHLFCILTVFLFLVSFLPLWDAEPGNVVQNALFSVFFFSVTITTQLDAYSRYQNYKFVKDLFHEYGFRELLVKPFSRSRCQRDAALEAAKQLGLRSSIDRYYYNTGYRWYHIIPSVLIKNPLLLLTRGYWRTTFFVPKYNSKYFYW